MDFKDLYFMNAHAKKVKLHFSNQSFMCCKYKCVMVVFWGQLKVFWCFLWKRLVQILAKISKDKHPDCNPFQNIKIVGYVYIFKLVHSMWQLCHSFDRRSQEAFFCLEVTEFLCGSRAAPQQLFLVTWNTLGANIFSKCVSPQPGPDRI